MKNAVDSRFWKLAASVATVLVFAASFGFAGAQQVPDQVDQAQNELPDTWFVELSSPPSADGTNSATLTNELNAFRAAAAAAGIVYTERQSFQTLWNGVSVRANSAQLAKLQSLPGVKAVYPVRQVFIDATRSDSGTDLASAIEMTGADIVQNTLGFTGKGIKVAVMDTGIDYNHPDLGGCFGPGCRVAKGYDFVGDAYNADPASPSYNPVPVPDPNPDDCNGHGTHVAGIVGANGVVRGVAPEVTFFAYRVFGCEGSTTDEVMLAAMELTHKDKADVLNMSIGSPFAWPQSPTAQAADRLAKHGVVVVASIGNSGANGLYSAGAPGLGERVIGVASFDNTFVTQPAFTISPDNKKIGYSAAAGAPPPPTSGSLPMARTGTTTTANDACAALPAGSLAGTATLIRRGTCSFYIKAFNAQSAGAAAVVLYNNAAGFVSPTVAGTPAITIPVVMVTAADGAVINGRIALGPVTMTWTDGITSTANPTGGLISSFSSYGLSPDLSLKPDIGAPGGSLYSTYPLELLGGYASLSGTSMSSPHVAGAAALLLQAAPKTKAEDVRDILQNSAIPAPWWGNPGLGFLDNVHRQGAGMLRIDNAILATSSVTPGKLSLGEFEQGAATQQKVKIEIQNDSDSTVTYTLGHAPALATGANTFVPSFLANFAAVSFDPPMLTLKKHEKKKVDVFITGLANPAGRLFGGYVTVTPSNGAPVLRVPYAGYNGDYQLIQALTPTANGFPWLAKLVGTNFVNQPAGATYTLVGDDIPFILVHLHHQSALLQLEVIDTVTGKSKNFVFSQDFVERNSTATAFFAFAWDGTTFNKEGKHAKPAPNGTYNIVVTSLKALGDKKNPADTETWTSPTITIARP